jgi:hypothetical protein
MRRPEDLPRAGMEDVEGVEEVEGGVMGVRRMSVEGMGRVGMTRSGRGVEDEGEDAEEDSAEVGRG